jgi:hypothetical protein
MRVVIFDIETRLSWEDLSDDKEMGWARLRAGDGGISAICVYDMQEGWLYIYDDTPLSLRAAISHLESADVVVGYRSEAFDRPCLEGVWGRRIKFKEHIDLYALIARRNAGKGIVGKRGEFKLGTVCKRTFGRGKTGSGAHAPQLAKEGRWGELFNYCGHDVRLTRDLLVHIAVHGSIVNSTGNPLTLQLPEWVRRALNVRYQPPDLP